MKDKEAEWTHFFRKVFIKAREMTFKRYPLEKDGSGPPETLAIRDIATKLPCPLRIAEIRIDVEKHEHIRDAICQIIRYDFSKLGITQDFVEYYGIVGSRDSEQLRKLLIDRFDLKETMFDDVNRNFRTIGWFQGDSYTQFPLYDIRADFQKFVRDFLANPFNILTAKACRNVRKHVDWSSKFSLKPDPVASMSEITRMDETLGGFPPFSEGAGIEKLQEDICNIQLIPSVPWDVKELFRRAKDLHIHGFFRFSFFAIAQHYAYLALESAIKNRYYQSFNEENTLENDKRETVKVGRIDHQTLIEFCRRTGWNRYKLKINGKKFAFKQEELHCWLVKEGIITDWERKQCDRGMTLRNLMSHPTKAYVFPPSYSTEALEFVADIINKLYSSSTCPAKDNTGPVFPADLSPSRV